MRLRVASLVVVAGLSFACGEDAAPAAATRAGGRAGQAGAAGAGAGAGASGAAGKAAAGTAGAPGGGGAGIAGNGSSGGGQGGAAAGASGSSAGSSSGSGGSSGTAGSSSAGAGTGGIAGTGGGTSGGGGNGTAGESSGGAAGEASGGAAGEASGGAAGESSGGAAGGPIDDPFTYAYQENGNFVRYRALPNVFEKTTGYQRDQARKMMPIDLHSWSIANFNRDLLMFADYRLADASGQVIFDVHDTEGAVHVALAQNDRETSRGNNHQAGYADFLIAEGDYTLVFTLLPTSKGRPSLVLWRQRPDNLFTVLVGAAPSDTEKTGLDGADGYLVGFEETVSRTFRVTYVDQDNVLYKSNANGFESP